MRVYAGLAFLRHYCVAYSVILRVLLSTGDNYVQIDIYFVHMHYCYIVQGVNYSFYSVQSVRSV